MKLNYDLKYKRFQYLQCNLILFGSDMNLMFAKLKILWGKGLRFIKFFLNVERNNKKKTF